jgi:acetolactate synthase-1/2/3 large subunit
MRRRAGFRAFNARADFGPMQRPASICDRVFCRDAVETHWNRQQQTGGTIMNGGKLVVQSLRAHGVDCIFGLIDTTILDIIDAIYDEPALRYVPVRHEQVASMMADGHSRGTGRPGVCISQCGPGAMNLLYGIASSFKDSVPIVAITGNIDSSLLGRDTWHDIDVVELYRPVTKWSTRVTTAEEIPAVLDKAFRMAMEGRPGPVHVNIPKDVQMKTVAPEAVKSPKPAAEPYPRPAPAASDVDKAIAMLAAAERPVIFAGGGVVRARASAALVAFSEQTGIPVIVTDTSRGVIPERHPNAIGPSGLFGTKAASEALKEADLILGIGTRFPDVSTGNWSFIGPATKVIQNNIDPQEIGRRLKVALGVPGDAGKFIDALRSGCKPQSAAVMQRHAARNASIKSAVEAENEAFLTPPVADGAGASSRIPIHLVIREIEKVLKGDEFLAADGGLHTSYSGKLHIQSPDGWLVSAGLGSMGYGLPAAMGAKLAQPNRRSIALVGDGGFAMVSQDLETAVRCDIPVVVVVYNNSALGAQRLRQQRDYGGRMIGTLHGNPDYGDLAKLYGAEGRTIRTIGEFRPAFEQMLASGKVGVLDVLIA